jgi:hypothetical protein
MMREFKFLNDNKDDGIIGAYNEEDLYVPVQLTDIYNGRVFTISYFLLQNIRRKACALYLLPNLADGTIQYNGLFSYDISSVQGIENQQIEYHATIWFRTHAGILTYNVRETILL